MYKNNNKENCACTRRHHRNGCIVAKYVELELCKEFVVCRVRRAVRPHRTGWRNDAQIRTHEMKVAARARTD